MGIAVVALMLSINLYSIKEQLERQVDARIDSIEVAYQTVFVTPLAEQNYAALHEIVDSWKKTGDISYIAVMDANGQRLDGIGIPHGAQIGRAHV